MGFISVPTSPWGNTTTPITEVCPICNGSKKQTITETDPVLVHNESILLT